MNVIQRAINRLGRPIGVRLFPWQTEYTAARDPSDHRAVFDAIHRTNHWESEESLSGAGSTISRTAEYTAALSDLIRRRGFRSLFDAPCGDLNWMPKVIEETGIHYIGGDVSQVALDAARRTRPDADLRLFDIRLDRFPEVDVWHCRDCLFHLSFADGLDALRNFSRSSIPYALITTNSGLLVRNMDIVTGAHRVTDLQRAPYNLPKPIEKLKDYPRGVEFPRYVALWSRETIRATVLI